MIRTLIVAAALASAALASAAPVFAQAAPPAPAKVAYIQAGSLLDKPGQAPRGNSTIIVRDGKIAEIRSGFVAPEGGATLVDLRDRFVLPGLIDLHVHLWGIGADPLRARLEETTRDDADDQMTALANARVTLDAGFTSVRDLGGNIRGIRAIRDAIDRGDIDGPTITNAGQMISVTGGHGDGGNGLREDFADAVHSHEVNLCDGPDECRAVVRRMVGMGAKVIKFAATGGVLSNVSGGLGRAMTPEEMRAIVETAHTLGRKVAAHSHAAEGTKAALLAGVDTIEHGSFLDEEAIALFKKTGAYLVPTDVAPIAALEQARAGALPPAVIPKAEAAAAALAASHKRAWAAGVKFAFGTDSGVAKHGENAREFSLLVRDGMTPAQAIRSATVAAADALGQSDTIGTIEPGKYADIIAVQGSPLEDVKRLEVVDFVMHRGVVEKSGGHRAAHD